MQKAWSFFSSIRFAIYLTSAITVVAVAGSFSVMRNADLYEGIDHAVLMEWWTSNGMQNLEYLWWIPVLIVLVFFFGLNTFICSIDRLIPISRFYFREKIERVTIGGQDMEEEDPSLFTKRRSIAPFYPYIAHIGFLIALIGHLVGSIGGFKSYGNVVMEGSGVRVPHNDGLYLLLDRFDVTFSRYGYPEEMRSHVRIVDGKQVLAEKVVEVNSPLIYQGLAFYASNFQRAPNGRFYVAFTVIKDPGVWLLFTGLFIFTAGTLLTLFMKKEWAELTKRAEAGAP